MSDKLPNQKASTNRKPQSYRDLLVWQMGISLVQNVYKLTASVPPEEKFGLISQMRRAAVSIPSNIAEGQARNTTGEFIQFISQAEGSLAELDTQLIISVQLSFVSADKTKLCTELIDELRRMLNSLRRSLTGQKPAPQN
jgi:four helix bundle protein